MKRTNKISPKTEEPKKVRFLEETIEQSDDEHFDNEDQGDIDSQEGGSVESLRDEDDDDMDGDDEEEEDGSKYEEDLEDEATIKERRKKLPKSQVDDRFFNLSEMDAFCEAQEQEEEARRGRNLGEFRGSEDVSRIMKELEEDNLKQRGWDLSGEVTAEERGKNELLEKFIDVDYRAQTAPTITPDVTDKIENMIKRRIRDNLFDDVERKVRLDESLIPAYRNKTAIEEGVRKSLAEVYGDKMNDKINEDDKEQEEEKLYPEVEAIKKDMDSLFKKLDALSHFQFKPPEILPEVKIIKNLPSFRVEEVGPMASCEPNATLLAPEEVFSRNKAPPMAKDERTLTDKRRERRKKKIKQRVLASKGVDLSSTSQKVESSKSGKKDKKAKMIIL